MTEHIHVEDKKYIKASIAAERIGYTSDYVTRLARTEKISAIQSGRSWYVDIDSLKLFSLEVESEKRERSEQLRQERIRERSLILREVTEASLRDQIESSRMSALAQTVVIASSFFVFLNLVWFSFESRLNVSNLASGVSAITNNVTDVVYSPIPAFLSQFASFAFIEHRRELVVEQQKVIVGGEQAIPVASSDDTNFQGIVVFDNDTVSREELEEVRTSFSDEVRIDFDGDDTGIVTPIFRERSGEAFRFLLVPVEPPGS